ncbi:Rrf2 family transcriptional regulator [Desulfopila sp. IMCC35006]|uniref:RrF2 family transcriptional regulator n=1 Tax=Desulfopila sp. IMCC35006 TaxID=2569542 RepID=UPI0010AC1321|nr:Rrf2 family transcriptional regulator [Desulfopila sp. IMCC35006]TKB25348.1 Rrf2 family transcriptional regulator [Desulfopila sp. IMCC35006]
MQYSIGVEYAFHSLFYMVDLPEHKTIGIKQIAELNGITETYLSKVFAKLRKAGIVRSIAGVKGGYQLAKSADAISFWDIIEAIEGPSFLFQCAEIRKKNIFVDDPSVFTDKCPCLIKVVIQEAEELMRNQLRVKSLQWLHEQVHKDFSVEKKDGIVNWLKTI